MQYPVSEKSYFDPVVARISNSLQPYVYLKAKVSVVDRRDDGGWLWFQPLPYETHNERTICYYSEADARRFDQLKEGQSVTVAGMP